MRKKIIIAISLVLLIGIIFVGCSYETITDEGVYKLISYSTNSNEASREAQIEVSYKDPNTNELKLAYKYDGESHSYIDGVDFKNVQFAGFGSGITLTADVIKGANLKKDLEAKTFSYEARLDNTKTDTVLGVKYLTNVYLRANGQMATSKKEADSLDKIEVEYDQTLYGNLFHVKVVVNLKK